MKLRVQRLAPYAAALIAVGAALFLRQGLVWLVGLELPPYITFYPMVMLVALTAGFGPGIVATVAAALLAQYCILLPRGEFYIESAPDVFGLSLFIGMAVLMCATVEVVRITRQRATPGRESAEAAAQPPSSGKPLLLFLGLILSLAILISVSGLTIRYMGAEAEADRRFKETVSVIQELDRLVSAMKDVETGQRGYMITRDDSYLKPYTAGLGEVEAGLAELQRLTRDNPRQQQRLAVLVPLIREKLSNARSLNEWRRAGGSPMAKAAVDLRARGKDLMDGIRRVTAEARAEEEQLLRQRPQPIAISRKNTRRALLVGDFFVLPLLAVIFFSLTRENVRREKEIAERQKSEQRLRLLIDGAKDYAIIMLDVYGRVISWNEGAKRLEGWDEKEILARHFSLFYPEEEVFAGTPERELGIAASQGSYAEEGWRMRKDGSRFMADVVITAIRDHSGQLQGFSKVTRDITERQRALEALREKEQMLILQSRQAAMGEMIGNIAHQWRQPLNTLGLSIQQLKLYYQHGEFTKEFLDLSVRNSMDLIEHMSKTIDDFRNYFKPDKEKGDFKVREAIERTLSLLEDSFKSRNIRFEVIAKDDPVIHGYQNEFTQVLLNILNNASDVLTERKSLDPKVTITFGIIGRCSVVTIADNAGGIPEEIIRKVFDPYFTTKGPQQGTGIGLYMSKIIIEKNMGGKLSVLNLADGAEFRIEVCNGSNGRPQATVVDTAGRR